VKVKNLAIQKPKPLTDASVRTDKSSAWVTGEGQKPLNIAVPALRSDQVAEQALECCAVVLERCPVTNGERLIELLQRFGAVAALGRDLAAEEVCARHQTRIPVHF
jgi:hypothetical protein